MSVDSLNFTDYARTSALFHRNFSKEIAYELKKINAISLSFVTTKVDFYNTRYLRCNYCTEKTERFTDLVRTILTQLNTSKTLFAVFPF